MASKNGAATGLSKDDSLVIKGVAILAMMWNHCYLKGRFEQFDLSFYPLGQSRVVNIAVFMKVCVSLFAFVSGYGLFCSLEREGGLANDSMTKNLASWYGKRYIKSFSDYWLIVLLACIICQAIDGRTTAIYFKESMLTGIFYMTLDLLGVSKLFGTPLLISTWWYMSAAFVFILFAPLLYWLIKRLGGVFCIGFVMVCVRMIGTYPGGMNYLSFLPAFIIGMVCAKNDVFQRIKDYTSASEARYIVSTMLVLAAVVLCYKYTQVLPLKKFWDIRLGLFVPVYITAIYLTVARVPVINTALMFLGTWSAEIFMIHSFFRSVYVPELIYASGNFMFAMLRLLAVGWGASVLFRLFRRAVHYELFVNWLMSKQRN